MPVYNEVRTLRTIVERVLNAPVDIEIELCDRGRRGAARSTRQKSIARHQRGSW
jgi:hypothetical protein